MRQQFSLIHNTFVTIVANRTSIQPQATLLCEAPVTNSQMQITNYKIILGNISYPIEYYITKHPLAFQITRWRFQALYVVREVVLWDTFFVLVAPLQSFSCKFAYLPIRPGRIPESVCLQLGSWHGNAFLEICHKMNQGRAKRGRRFQYIYIYVYIYIYFSLRSFFGSSHFGSSTITALSQIVQQRTVACSHVK